jgi:hypothetical protein
MTQSGHSTFLARPRLDLYSPGPRIDRWSSRRSSSGSRFHLLPFPGGPQRLQTYPPATSYAPPPGDDYVDAPPSEGDYNDEGNYGNGQPQEGDYAGAPPPEGY